MEGMERTPVAVMQFHRVLLHNVQADTSNHAIRLISPASQSPSGTTTASPVPTPSSTLTPGLPPLLSPAAVTTLAGSPTGAVGSVDGVGSTASFNNPIGIAVDPALTYALVVSSGAGTAIREGGHVLTHARFSSRALQGDYFNVIRRIDLATGTVTSLSTTDAITTPAGIAIAAGPGWAFALVVSRVKGW